MMKPLTDREIDHLRQVELGQRLRTLREQRGMPQEHIAMTMRASRKHRAWRNTTVAKVESAERVLRATEVQPVAEILGVTIHVLLGMPEPSNKDVAIEELERIIFRASARIQQLEQD